MYIKEYNGLVSDLALECQVSYLNVLCKEQVETCFGIWDTGSFRTVISTKLAKRLDISFDDDSVQQLKSMGGDCEGNEAMVNLRIGEFYIPHIIVLVVEPKSENQPDIIVGMDIINMGRFIVDATSGTTKVYFDFKRDEDGNPIIQHFVYDK